MDISFHYYAIKTLAVMAGFSGKEAQIIAQYSQYVDDYNPVASRRYGNVPDWIKNKSGSDIYISDKLNPCNFRPVTTGFAIPEDVASMITDSFQKNVISPFHFIPVKATDQKSLRDKNSRKNVDTKTYPVKITEGGDGTCIANLLMDAKREYLDACVVQNEDAMRQALMHIGMLLHVFADTYAHQLFSGYQADCNNMKIISITDNYTGELITDRTATYIEKLLKLYKITDFSLVRIGHMLVGSVPDWTHVSFELGFYDDKGGLTRRYERNNTVEFTEVAMEILDFLCECRSTPKFGGTVRDNFKNRLYDTFKKADISTVAKVNEKLDEVWNEQFAISYNYKPSEIFDGIVKSVRVEEAECSATEEDGIFPDMSEDFYVFNSYAEDLLITLYGINPRK